jgi:general secretion pathway protein D
MKFIMLIAVPCCFLVLMATGQPQAATQERPKTVIQTPFGAKEVEQTAAPGTEKPAQNPPPPAAPPLQGVPGNTPLAQPPVSPADAAPQPAPGQAQDPSVPIDLEFDNADIYQVIKIIGSVLNLNYLIDPTVKGTVNLHTLGNLRRSDLLPILETVLKINGATMVRTGNFYEIVPANTAVRQPIEVRERVPEVDPDDQIVMQIVRLKFVAASEMSRLLMSYLSDGGNINAYESGSILLISERRSNLRKLLEIIDIFDANAFEGARIRMLPVKNASARDLIDDLKTIFAGYALSATTSIRFAPIDRLNSILVVSSNPDVFPEIEKWMDRLDQPRQTAGLKTFVYNVKNAKAADIQRVLAEVYGYEVNQTQSNPAPRPNTPTGLPLTGQPLTPGASGGPQGQVPLPAQTPAQQPQTPTAAVGPRVRIIADQLNNALVIQTTAQDYAEIEKTIQQIDIMRRQVLIDAQVYEVVLSDALSFGLSATLQNRGTLVNPQTTGSFTSTSGALNAQTFSFIGRARELVTFLNASDNRSRVRTLSAPSVLVSDNSPATFEVGTEVPVPTSSSITPVTSGGTNLFAQTISFRDTGVILQVRPQINEGGNVTLDIAQEISQAGTNTVSAIVAPTIGKSSVTSTVVIQDGQTIALGGFIRENKELDQVRIPIIGRIPGVGALLGSTNRANTRTELIILITPHVIRNHQAADVATDELKAKLKEIRSLLN